jgi:hypothetical protein
LREELERTAVFELALDLPHYLGMLCIRFEDMGSLGVVEIHAGAVAQQA